MSKKKINNEKVRQLRLLNDDTPFAIKESFSQLRTNILYSSADNDSCPVYAFTSSYEHVGKSTVSSNVAVSFAQINKKVLLIDADMRRSTQYIAFNDHKNHFGLSELLAGIIKDPSEVICSPMENLSVLLAGCIPPNPSELLNSKRFEDLLNTWKNEYDIIFIDLPPVDSVSDPLTVAHLTDGYILVAMAGKSNAKRVNSVIASLEALGAKIIGIILNGSSLKKNGGYYRSYKYSGYYGGYYNSYRK